MAMSYPMLCWDGKTLSRETTESRGAPRGKTNILSVLVFALWTKQPTRQVHILENSSISI